MPPIIIQHVKGSELPKAWKKKIHADPNKTFKVTIEPEDEDSEEKMPPEEMISDELIESVKRSEKSYKEGKFTTLKSKKEIDKHFNKLWNE